MKTYFLDPKIVPASPIPTQTAGRCFKCAQLQETKEKTFKLVRNCEYEKWGFQLEEVCDGRIICKVIFHLNFLQKTFRRMYVRRVFLVRKRTSVYD